MTTETDPLRIVHVGLGGWGRSWAVELLKHPSLVRTEAYVDIVPAMFEALRAEAPAIEAGRYFTQLDDALRAAAADTVLVTTALPHHASVAIAALEAGKHVIVEKPMAPTLEEGQRMIDAAEAAGRQLVVSQNYRHYPAARKAAELVRTQALGRVGGATVAFRKWANTAEPDGWAHYKLPDPLLLDMSVHHFDLMRYVLGRSPVAVSTAAWNPSWSKFHDPAAAVAQLEFDGDVVVEYSGSWVSTGEPTLWAGEWVIECEGGTIEWTSRNDLTTDGDRLVVRRRGGSAESIALEPLLSFDRVGTIADFVAARREGRLPLTHARDNFETLALTLAAIESARTKQRLAVTTEAAADLSADAHEQEGSR